MRLFRSILLLSLTLIIGVSLGQRVSFQMTMGGDGKESLYAVLPLHGTGIVVVGYSTSFGNGKDLYVAKLTEEGDKIWSKAIGGEVTDLANAAILTKDGNILIGGSTTSFGAQRADAMLTLVSPEGELLWSHTYGGNLNDRCFDVAEAKDGGYVLVGETNSEGAADHDMFVVKTNVEGEIEWNYFYGTDSVDYANSVEVVSDGIIVGGESNGLDPTEWNIWVTKIDWSGDIVWTKSYGGLKSDNQDDLILDSDTSFVVVGSTESLGPFTGAERDVYFMKINAKGEPFLVKTFGGPHSDEPKAVHKTPDGGYFITGFSNSFNEGVSSEDAYLLRLTANGKVKYSKTFGNEGGEFIWASGYENGTIYLAGETTSFGDIQGDIYMYLVGVPDSRKMFSCELTNVQSVATKHDWLIFNQLMVFDAYIQTHGGTMVFKTVQPEIRDVEDVIRPVCSEGRWDLKEYEDVFKHNPEEEGAIIH